MGRRIQTCLARLVPHLDRAHVALTGGVAIAWHLETGERNAAAAQRPIGDVDLVAETVEAVRPTVVEDFLVSHLHLPQPGYATFLIQLVDPVSGLRVDVFPDSLGAVSRARQREVAGVSLRVLELSAVLDHKLVLLAQAPAPVEEKHDQDARLLGALCGRPIPDRPAAALGPTVYSHDLTAVCPRCAASGDPRFPLASKRRIHDILGYV